MSETDFQRPTMTIKIDKSEVERQERERADKLLLEKEALAKEITELKQKEAERLESEKLAAEEKEASRANKRPVNGSVPFNPPQNFDSRRAYNDFNEMYSDLKAKEMATGNETQSKESRAILDQLWGTVLKGAQNGIPFTSHAQGEVGKFDNGKPISQILAENYRMRRKFNGAD
jgi:hypothetical protein